MVKDFTVTKDLLPISEGHNVQLWVNDAFAFAFVLDWMAAEDDSKLATEVLLWNAQSLASCESRLQSQPPPDVLIKAFGCEIAIEMIAARACIHWAGATFDA